MSLRRFTATTFAVVIAFLVTTVATPASASPNQRTHDLPVTTVPSVDLQQYQGRWLQLAAIPAPFSRQCVSDVSAEYTLLSDGLVKVLNSCTQADGSISNIEGRARVVDAATNSKLQVTFVQVNGEWNFQAAGDYWILGLARNYRWVVVGDPNRNNGFILARTPHLTLKEIAGVASTLIRNGYDPCRFQITQTTGGAPASRGLCEVGQDKLLSRLAN